MHKSKVKTPRFKAGQEAPPVLIVDDELMNIEVMKSLLTLKGVSVHTAMSGKQALILLNKRIHLVQLGKAEMYKLVLLDFSMPEMDGL